MIKFHLGYDIYEIYCVNISYYIDYFTHQHIQLYHMHKTGTYTYLFSVRRMDSIKLKKMDLPIQFIQTVGSLYYMTRFFKNRVKLIGLMTFILVYLYTSQYLLNIKITGTLYQVNEDIVLHLKEDHISFFDKKLTLSELEALKSKLLERYSNEIDWLNVYQKGQTLFIEYTNKKDAIIVTKDARPIVSCKESVIKEFQVQSGYIVSSINQYVQPGQILVSNAIVSTFDETILVHPKGQIFGYTWYDLEAETNNLDQADAFNTLLMQIRNELSTLVGENATIDKEKVLQFTIDDSKIKLRVHYTMIEDIGCKGDMNEQNTKTN